MKHNIGIMQGRLTEPRGRGIQFFPFENWEKEFHIAKEIGLDDIEFIFDYEDYGKNPLWDLDGIQRIKAIREQTGVDINAVCFDYFMRRPFFKQSGEEKQKLHEENSSVIQKVLHAMDELAIGLIEIPLVDDSSMKNDTEKSELREWLLDIVQKAPQTIKFGLETDLAPRDFLNYLETFQNERIGANYDSGNSSGIGYDHYEEVTTLRKHIFNIHIKDRVYHGTTVRLGTGSADFEKLFRGLKEIAYDGDFILQAARGVDGQEKNNICDQKNFLDKLIKKYNL